MGPSQYASLDIVLAIKLSHVVTYPCIRCTISGVVHSLVHTSSSDGGEGDGYNCNSVSDGLSVTFTLVSPGHVEQHQQQETFAYTVAIV